MRQEHRDFRACQKTSRDAISTSALRLSDGAHSAGSLGLRNFALNYIVIGAAVVTRRYAAWHCHGRKGGFSVCAGSRTYQSDRVCLSFDLWDGL